MALDRDLARRYRALFAASAIAVRAISEKVAWWREE
jgi:hypothetical protein